ncbi:MAG: FkbM family methyltransferase, partial [Burkholderiales bacterium]|nr:FkbM family methyltransferase [Burkholderiales bacterium]
FEFMTLYIYKEIFVDGCYDVSLPTGNPVIIDVGANTGLFIIRMKQIYPHATVFGYEPMPANFLQPNENLALSNFSDCHVFMSGIGATTRKAELFTHEKNIGGHSLYASQGKGGGHMTVDLLSLSDALQNIGGGDKACDFLKLDCEGAEYEIIKSINQEMARNIRCIIFEATPALYSVQETTDHLCNLGYQVKKYRGLWLATRY